MNPEAVRQAKAEIKLLIWEAWLESAWVAYEDAHATGEAMTPDERTRFVTAQRAAFEFWFHTGDRP